MQSAPDKEKPTLAGAGSLVKSCLEVYDAREGNQIIIERQAAHIRACFVVSLPLGRAIAEIAFATGGGK